MTDRAAWTRRALALGFLLFSLVASSPAGGAQSGPVVDAITMTVSNLDESMAFYEGVLGFRKISQAEVRGATYERLYATFGLRVRPARFRLGIEAFTFKDPDGHPLEILRFPAGKGARTVAPSRST